MTMKNIRAQNGFCQYSGGEQGEDSDEVLHGEIMLELPAEALIMNVELKRTKENENKQENKLLHSRRRANVLFSSFSLAGQLPT